MGTKRRLVGKVSIVTSAGSDTARTIATLSQPESDVIRAEISGAEKTVAVSLDACARPVRGDTTWRLGQLIGIGDWRSPR